MTIKQLVVFSILMEGHGEGILGAAPSYISEKFEACQLQNPEGLLDERNLQTYHQYMERWTEG